MGTADDESARGIEVVDGLLIQVLSGHHRLDHVLQKLGADILKGTGWRGRLGNVYAYGYGEM